MRAGHLLDRPAQRPVERVREILQDQTDAGRAALAQHPRAVVAAEAERLDRLLDAALRFRRDPGSPLTTRETVLRPTPARAATSFIVGRLP
ncbi:hypothetical protein SHKM778_57860 [Streptomyces sp. KM77-8]|uniref:Uncharacterized protein n=1 Tax=Streptomyces haneummycinicus TaxID=3074435 RepID=A0AAT9HPL7_9ACTN